MKNPDLSEIGLQPELLRKINAKDTGSKVLEKNEKLLNKLMKLERSLVTLDKDRKVLRI